MKKTTKFISLLLSVLMVCTCFAGLTFTTASAAAPEQLIYFSYPTDGSWGDASAVKVSARNKTCNIYCYVYTLYGNENPLNVYAFGANATACKKVDGVDNLYSFDLSKYSTGDFAAIEDNADYGVIFSTKNGAGYQTTDLTMNKSCLGDTIVVTEKTPTRENTSDSSKKDFCAKWQNSTTCGMRGGITSLNNVLDGFFPASMPKAKPLSDSLKKYLTNATNLPFYQWEQTAISAEKKGGCNKTTCEKLGVEPIEVYNQYVADNKDAIETGTIHPADDTCPVDYIEYEGYNDAGVLATMKMAAPSVVASVLNLSYPPEEPTTEAPTTEEPTTEEPTTEAPTTEAPTTVEPTTEAPTTEEPTTEAPTTVEPTTEAPTTVEPTTEAPTTVEPTTEAPTTVEPTTEPAPAEDVYSVAGSIDELGKWDATSVATEMTKGDDGKYSFTTAITAQNDVLFKVVKNHSWDTAYGDNGNNVSFNVTKDCDVTITFDPATEEITVTGEGVEQPKVLEIESMRAVGNGEGNWLNGVAWDPANDANLMTKVADGIYEITFENVGASFGYDVKCAANGSWAANWGVPKNSGFKPESGVQFDAGWDGDNAGFEVDEDGATVKVQIDVSNFDLASKSGAKMTITVSYPEPSGKLYGDINGDGQITIDDATTLQKYIVKMVDLDDDAKICADVNGDGRISVMDVTFIQRYLAGSTGKAYGYENLTGKVAIPENV